MGGLSLVHWIILGGVAANLSRYSIAVSKEQAEKSHLAVGDVVITRLASVPPPVGTPSAADDAAQLPVRHAERCRSTTCASARW